jgi:hypothetical protein
MQLAMQWLLRGSAGKQLALGLLSYRAAWARPALSTGRAALESIMDAARN